MNIGLKGLMAPVITVVTVNNFVGMDLGWRKNDTVTFLFLYEFAMSSLTAFVAAYKPILDEVEKILAEAGLDEEEMRRGAAGAHGGGAGTAQNRNRR